MWNPVDLKMDHCGNRGLDQTLVCKEFGLKQQQFWSYKPKERGSLCQSRSIDRSLSPENRYVVLEEEKQFSRCVTGRCMQRDWFKQACRALITTEQYRFNEETHKNESQAARTLKRKLRTGKKQKKQTSNKRKNCSSWTDNQEMQFSAARTRTRRVQQTDIVFQGKQKQKATQQETWAATNNDCQTTRARASSNSHKRSENQEIIKMQQICGCEELQTNARNCTDFTDNNIFKAAAEHKMHISRLKSSSLNSTVAPRLSWSSKTSFHRFSNSRSCSVAIKQTFSQHSAAQPTKKQQYIKNKN
jgi:hypothetical protein